MGKILVLDDVKDACILLKKILERKGHQVVTFTEEVEAINYLRNNSLDLVILDIKLKKIDGIQVLRAIRKISSQIKVIMLTGYPSMETAQAAQKLRVSAYMLKPVEKEELEKKVEELLMEKKNAQ